MQARPFSSDFTRLQGTKMGCFKNLAIILTVVFIMSLAATITVLAFLLQNCNKKDEIIFDPDFLELTDTASSGDYVTDIVEWDW